MQIYFFVLLLALVRSNLSQPAHAFPHLHHRSTNTLYSRTHSTVTPHSNTTSPRSCAREITRWQCE